MLTRNDLNKMRNQIFGVVIIILTLPIASAAQAERVSVLTRYHKYWFK